MEEDDGGISSKTQDWQLLFLLIIKIKQNLGCPNKEYDAIFEQIHQNSGPIPEVKKSVLINDFENITACRACCI